MANAGIEADSQCREKYPVFYDELLALLFRHDPIRIHFEINTDEYSPEVRTIIPRLESCKSADDVLAVMIEEFTTWFGDAGPKQRYEPIAAETWELWRGHQRQTLNNSQS